ncbi:hypothetical protein SAMD00023353_2700880 [Rosellinia necatrix]|uniref:Rho-GAP domain-containing protein n=1 Tax=Rosellinia necatrix TaxID=77044 RepID=A0A1W2TGT5_ROSNE|nr:hypothetical protein SAMD00023353_2700880 [Rosellinia necatrix]
MGRRSAPQPLALAEGNSSFAGNHDSKDLPSSTASPAATATTISSPESTAPGTTDRPSPHSLFAADNTLQVLSPSVSSVSNKSPKSPRSPFSKFNPARRPQTQQGETRSQPIDGQPSSLPPPRAVDDTHIVRQQADYHSQNSNPPAAPHIKQSATSPILPQPTGHTDEKHTRSGSRFFNFGKGSKSNNQLHHSHTASNGETMSRGVDLPIMAERVPSKASKHSDRSSSDLPIQKPAPIVPSKSEAPLPPTEHDPTTLKKGKPKPFALLGRNRSLKEQDDPSPLQSIPTQITEPEKAATFDELPPLKTAPINPDAHDRSFRNMMNSSTRNHSADRAVRDMPSNKEHRHDKENRSQPPSIRDNGGSTFLGGLRSSGSRAADMISKGLFGKGGRSASTSEREPVVDDEHYVLKVINLPLVEQTRKTRISKRLEESRDKTEFWMPAFPWRAIDYLNFNGTEVEGLYRVPGSGPQIKKWQRKFDEEGDVDLFNQTDLYDINIIGSMLKAWLRELPDELFPKEAQERISRQCAGAEKVPQMLVEELSNLPPFKYYLLFAVTCHLSLLLAHSDKNKMDFRNLCICFQPCMKIDAFCFKFLVCDWRLCWQGCRNEARYIEEEYKLFQQPLPKGFVAADSPANNTRSNDDRAISSDGNKTSRNPEAQNGKPRKRTLAPAPSNGNLNVDYSSSSANVAVERETTGQRSRELRPLSPIKPLSPMNF